MIVSLLKRFVKWSLALANKGEPSWCFHVKKLLTDIDLGHLNPENVTCLSAKEFQSITIAKLIDKANRKWKVRIWNPNAYSSDSGGRLHNYRVIKQKPSPESYLRKIIFKGHRWVMAAIRGGSSHYMLRLGDTELRRPIPPPDLQCLQMKFCWNWISFCNAVSCSIQDLRSCFLDCLSYLDNSFTPSPKFRNLSISFVQIIIVA